MQQDAKLRPAAGTTFESLALYQSQSATHTDLFIFLLNNQTKLLKTLWVQLLVQFFAPTRLSHCRSPFLQFWVELQSGSSSQLQPLSELQLLSLLLRGRLRAPPAASSAHFQLLPATAARPREQSCRCLARRQRYWGSNPRRVTAV